MLLKVLNYFPKIKDKEYKLTNKDLGFINYIYQEKLNFLTI